jgi:hypothetical protein
MAADNPNQNSRPESPLRVARGCVAQSQLLHVETLTAILEWLAVPIAWSLGGFALCGVMALGLIVWFWKSADSFLTTSWVKAVIEVVQAISLVAATGSAYAAIAHKLDWLPAALAGIICSTVWKAVHFLAEKKGKIEGEAIKEELARANQLVSQRTRLLTALRDGIRQKVKRLRKALGRRPLKPTISLVRTALTPEPHLQDLLVALAVFFKDELPDGQADNSNFRVGVYMESNGVMTPVHGVELSNPGYNPFSSFQQHKDRFRLNPENPEPAHAVSCVLKKSMVIEEDCVEAAKQGKFSFFNDKQATYLRSMVAVFLGHISNESGKMVATALVVDTDVAGFFKEAERQSLVFCMREFSARIRLEMLLLGLIFEQECKP